MMASAVPSGAVSRGWGPARQTLRTLLLRESALGLSPGALDTLVNRMDFACWRAGQEVASSDERPPVLRVVVGGVVKTVCHGPCGSPATVQLLGPGRLLRLAAPPPHLASRVRAVAHTPALVGELPPGAWRELVDHLRVEESLRFAECTWQALSRRLYEKCALLAQPIRVRVLLELRSLALDFGTPHPAGVCIDVPLSHADLASLIGAARANVTRAVAALRLEGVLVPVSGRFVLSVP